MKKLEELNLRDKKYIIFDLDGTLIDSIGIWNEVDRILLKKLTGLDINHGIIQFERDNFLNNNPSGNTYLNYSQYLIDRYNIEGISKEDLTERRVVISHEELNTVTFKPNVVKLIRELKNHGFKVILATMSSDRQINQYSKLNKNMIKEMVILDEFDLIITKNDVVNKKPHPEIYYKVMEYLGAIPSECLVFEDSYTGVMASRNANIEVVNVYDKYSDVDRVLIDELTTYKINNYGEFLEFMSVLYDDKVRSLKI